MLTKGFKQKMLKYKHKCLLEANASKYLQALEKLLKVLVSTSTQVFA